MDRLPRGLKIIFASIIVILTFFIDAKAQDANYWTHQYGSRSTLLGGAVIGSVLDLSATYYNPGALSLIDEPDVLLAAKVFEYPNYTIKRPRTVKVVMLPFRHLSVLKYQSCQMEIHR